MTRRTVETARWSDELSTIVGEREAPLKDAGGEAESWARRREMGGRVTAGRCFVKA